MPLPPELSISEEDWNHTPPAVQAVVLALWQQVQTLQTLPTQVATLQAEVAQLREQLGRNSQNSSQPPSASKASSRPTTAPSADCGGRCCGVAVVSVPRVRMAAASLSAF